MDKDSRIFLAIKEESLGIIANQALLPLLNTFGNRISKLSLTSTNIWWPVWIVKCRTSGFRAASRDSRKRTKIRKGKLLHRLSKSDFVSGLGYKIKIIVEFII